MREEVMPWVKEYKVFGIPETLEPYPDKPVHDILYQAAKRFPKNGIIQYNTKMPYPALKDSVERLATAMHALGLKKGDRVATLLPTSVQFIIADYAISRAGLVHIPSSSLEPADILINKFEKGSPAAIILLDEYEPLLKEILPRSVIRHIILCSLREYSDPKSVSKKTAIKGAHWMTDLIKKHAPAPPAFSFDVEKDLETLLFTGGTTGLPKGCMLTHRNIYANSIQNNYAFGAIGHMTTGAASVLLGLPFFHSYGHIIMHTMCIYGYNQLIVPDTRDTAGMVEMIKKHRPILQIGVPTQFMKLAENELKGMGMLAISGSAPLPANIQKEFEKKMSGGVMEGYGLSEMSPVTHLNTSLLLRVFGGRTIVRILCAVIGSPIILRTVNFILRLAGPLMVGKSMGFLISTLVSFSGKKKKRSSIEKRGTTGFPFPDTEVKIVDIDTDRPLTLEEIKAGKSGEMCLRGPQRMLGYWPEAGAGLDGDGYVRTGDIVRIDENGYFYIVDRTKDMVIVSGFKVYTREMEDILYAHPSVELAASVGVPDPEREGSERVVACLQLKREFAGKVTEEDIIGYLKERIAKYAVPKKVFFFDELPMTPVHKVDKKALKTIVAGKMTIPAAARK